ncbi:hypothetical protein NIES4071_17760 [Calothrix sp. NIES-4071]|nr:hypothetical protein NIES4071_17760 [Calothrix sp. NIES-4071]BAZ56109.1 hypothetical protein NIES4105_17710 [Calothrix sp. NIES-4105]
MQLQHIQSFLVGWASLPVPQEQMLIPNKSTVILEKFSYLKIIT